MTSPGVRGTPFERDPVSVLFDAGARRLLDRAYARPGQWVGTRVADPPPSTVAHFAMLGIDVTGPDLPSSPRAKLRAHSRWCRGFVRALYYQHKWRSPLGREGGWRRDKRIRPRTSGALEVEFGRRVPSLGVIPAGRAVRVRIRRGGQVARRAVERMSDDDRIWTDDGQPGALMSDPSRRDWLRLWLLHHYGMADEWVTQRELDQLRAEVIRIDDHGTRGVGTIQAQLTEVVKDVTELKAEMGNRFSEHRRQHEREQADRAINRRWGIGLAVAILAAIGGLYPYVHVITHR